MNKHKLNKRAFANRYVNRAKFTINEIQCLLPYLNDKTNIRDLYIKFSYLHSLVRCILQSAMEFDEINLDNFTLEEIIDMRDICNRVISEDLSQINTFK